MLIAWNAYRTVENTRPIIDVNKKRKPKGKQRNKKKDKCVEMVVIMTSKYSSEN
jgi:hypothetical protein